MTTLLNGIMWLRGVLTGTISQTITLLSGFNANFGSFSGNLTCNGQTLLKEARVCPLVTYGDVSTGTHLYYIESSTHVVTSPTGAAVAGGCIWKIGSTIGSENESITFETFDATTSITIQDPNGVTLATIVASAGSLKEVTCRWRTSEWVVLHRNYR